MRYPVILLLAWSLTACNPAYKRPTSENTAQVRFVAVQPKGWTSNVSIYANKGDTCSGMSKMKHLGKGFDFGGHDLSDAEQGMLKDPKASYVSGQYFETRIASDSRFYFTIAGSESQKICYMTSSFVPLKDVQYEISYVTSAANCLIRIDRLQGSNGNFSRSPESSAVKRKETCTFIWN